MMHQYLLYQFLMFDRTLYGALQTGNLPALTHIIEAGTDPCDTVNEAGMTLLHFAAVFGHLPLVDYLINTKKVPIDPVDRTGCTPLHYTCMLNQNVGVVQFLVAHGADPNCLSPEGASLHLAAKHNCCDIIKFLRDHPKVNVDVVTPINRLTPMHLAVFHDNQDSVRALLENPSRTHVLANAPIQRAWHADGSQEEDEDEPERVDHHNIHHCFAGDTPLIAAVREFNAPMMKILLDAQHVACNATNDMGDTALLVAARNNYLDGVQMLIKKEGIDVNQSDANQESPLWHAVDLAYPEIVQLLLSHPEINPNLPNESGFTPLHVAVSDAEDVSSDIVKALLASGANPHLKSRSGHPVMDWVSSEDQEAFARLVEAGRRQYIEKARRCYKESTKNFLTAWLLASHSPPEGQGPLRQMPSEIIACIAQHLAPPWPAHLQETTGLFFGERTEEITGGITRVLAARSLNGGAVAASLADGPERKAPKRPRHQR